MVKKNVLIVSRSFYPTIAPRAFRATELAKELARQGNQVIVLTKDSNQLHEKFKKEHNIQILYYTHQKENSKCKDNNSLSIIKKISWVFNKILLILFYYPYIIDAFQIYRKVKKVTGFDLLISIAVPYSVHWGVALARKNNFSLTKTWVADCGDPFLGNKESKFRHPFYFSYIENWFCKKPDYITIPIEAAINAYPSICKEKIRIIPQGFNFNEVATSSKTIKNSYPVFVYAGMLSKGVRDPRQFLEYLCSIKTKIFKFIIYTQSLSVVTPYKKLLEEKLEVHESIPRDQLLNEFGKVDFLVNFENRSNVQMPSKLIDYALTGKPILSITPNKLNTAIVDEFLAGNYSNRLIIKDIEQYDIKNVAKKFLSLLNNK